MEPPPFNFNAAPSTSGKPPGAPSAFGATVPKVAFGSSFGKPSILSQAAKRAAEAPTETKIPGVVAPNSSLASRLTVLGKNKESIFKSQGDTSDNKVPALQDGQFAIRPRAREGKWQIGSLANRRRAATPDGSENKTSSIFKNPPDPKPPGNIVKPSFFGRQNADNKSVFGSMKPIVDDDSHDEIDLATKKEAPVTMFGVPLATSSAKGFGTMFFKTEKAAPPFKPFADRTWKPSNRPSSAPGNQNRKMGPEEAKLIQSLVSLRGRKCLEDYDKYMLLDDRDKLLCQLREVDSPSIQRLERCEEMCTEKERYQRIVQKGVSPFECDIETGDVSHEMMVKQYARSAADQERPLPHELRSERIMNHAMCYLLHNILDEFPESPEQRAAWYNFLWNRTRALRKEVTQLSLSDALALNLVERCTRLHILFGYVLCDLETEHFDAAMNNETLGKCLQTLRHFYEDFEKRGIPCVNEAEFRSYDVMLHMNDTNILSQVLSYRSEVRQSQPVRLSLQLASAFRDKNYYRFFRLLQTQTSYLQCCVAHKLFTVTRSNAISIMANAYGRNSFPLDKLQRTLGFDSVSDLTSVLNIYGLRTEGSDYVVLSRDDLTLNETVPVTTYQWIDQKTSEKLSSVVYGPGLFQFIASRCDVSNSFNHHHEYVHDKVLDAVLSGSDITPINNSSISSFSQSGGSLSMQATIEQRKKAEEERLRKIAEAQRQQLVEKLMTKVIDQATSGIIDEEIRKAKILRKQMLAFENARKQKEEQERLIKEMESRRNEKEKEVARNLAMKIAKEAAEKELRRITVEEMKKERREREQKLAHHLVNKFWREILRSVDSQVNSICVEMVNEKREILGRLSVISNRFSKLWLLQFWNRWREWVRRKKMIRRCVPRWESEEYANNLVKKYGGKTQTTSPVFSILDHPINQFQLKIFKQKRQNRIVRVAFEKWRTRSTKMRALKKQAEGRQKRENEFYKRFEKSAKIETRFKFDAPNDWMKTKRRSSDAFQEKKSTTPDSHNGSFQYLDTSLYVARRHLEEWEPESEMPDDLKEKLKRKRDSFERICEEHLLKKKREEALLSDEAKKNNLHIEKVTKEADTLLDETLRYTAELDRMMADIKSRRVDDL